MSFLITGGALAAGEGIFNIISGISKNNQANRLAASNIRPWYNIPEQYYQNDNIAASQAESGLSPASLNYYTTQASRGLGSGVQGILSAGGDADNIAKLYDQFSQGLSKEAAEDQELKSQHIKTFMDANKDLAGQQTQQWALNYYDPYKDKAALAASLKNAGQSQIGSGFSDMIGAASSFAKGGDYSSESDNIPANNQTWGQKTGQPNDLTTESVGISPGPNIFGPSSLPPISLYQTGGGGAVLGGLSKSDALSPNVQKLLSIWNQQSVAAA